MESSLRRSLLLLTVSAIWFYVCSASPLRLSLPLSVDNSTLPLKRAASQDPSCPNGWMCEQQTCPGGVLCAAGETCINFEGTIACVPTGSSWCAINPSTYEAVGCVNGICCHGNCYISTAVCCDNPGVTCSIGSACNVCPPTQTCTTGATTCISQSLPPSSSTSPAITASPGITTSPTSPTISSSTTSQSGPAATVANIRLNFVDNSCSDARKTTLRADAGYAYNMAIAARDGLQNGAYYSHFFAQSLRNQPQFAADTMETFNLIADMISSVSPHYAFSVTCDDTSPKCGKKGDYATMNDITQIMNFCDRFFSTGDQSPVKDTAELLNNCGGLDIRAAQRSRAAIILHEGSHTTYAMRGGSPSLDYAYGFVGCTALAQGTFDRSCTTYAKGTGSTPFCPQADGTEGTCAAELSAQNADTYAHVAAGIYFSQMCNQAIPFPAPSATAKGKREMERRAGICPFMDDFIVWDDDNPGDNSIAVRGYVHFGDSYASGMGTGDTSTDSCRVGSNNYGDLLYRWFSDGSIDYQRHSCSGDTVDGLNNQIAQWSNEGVSTVGTVTMGGNDLGFSDLVYYCVITPNTARLGSTNRANCIDTENKARAYMTDTSANGLQAKLTAAYLSILNKANSRAFQLYVTSYPTFFNEQTTDCQYSSFHYFWGAYNPPSDFPINRIVYLTTDLRIELNNLVRELNEVILSAVQAANAAHGGNQVHFVDIVGSYNSHHWCEDGIHEPDQSVENTWFFLSAWPDVQFDTASEEVTEVSALIKNGPIQLPDASTCVTTPAAQLDPYLVAMCRVSQAVAEDPSGPEALRLGSANADIVAGNASSQSVSWYLPTRQIKTFHPRSPGMVAYRDAIIAALQANGQL